MSQHISEWKRAKELCEEIAHLDRNKQIEFINSSNENNSIKDKALNILQKLDHSFNLIESNVAEEILPIKRLNKNLIGKIIDNYELVKVLGSGGMSSVYLAKRTQSDIQKHVALKILSPYHTAEKYLELFYREQQSLAQLNHKNIVSFHHGGQTEDGTHYLVMDYVENAIDIVSYNKTNNLEISQSLKQIKTIARALSYAHGKNIIHRDIKSANILIDAQDEIKIVDFGIAYITNSKNDSSDSTKVFTLDIASPEQIQGKNIDARTDIFSLGALLLQIITGKAPLPKTELNQYNPIADQRHVDKLLKTSNLKPDLQNIIKKAMHIDVDRRYASMQEFADDIHNFLNFKPIKASTDSIFYRFNKLIKRNQAISWLIITVMFIAIVSMYFINNYSSESKKAMQQKNNSMAIINALFEQADPFKSNTNSSELVKALEKIEKSQESLLNSDPEFSYQFYAKMAVIYSQNGNYNEALSSKIKSLDALKQFVQKDDSRLIEAKVDEMRLLHSTGQYSDAIKHSNEYLKKLKAHPEINPVQVLMLYITLSRSYSALSQIEEQTKIHKIAIEFMHNHPEIDGALKADMFGSMAIAQYRNGNRELADKLFEDTIKTYRKLSDKSNNLAGAIRNYAATQVNYGNYEKADKLFQQSIDIYKNIDPRHPTLASSYLRYASLLAKTGQIQKAEELLTTAVDIFIEANDAIELPIAYTYLAELGLRKNSLESVFKYLLLANKPLQKQLQLDHPKTIKLYKLALWVLLIEPYSEYAEKIVAYLDSHDYVNSKNSKEYAFYQSQKDLLFQQSNQTDQRLSLIHQYLYSNDLTTPEQKINWLNHHIIASEKQTPLVNAYLKLWLIELVPNYDQFKTLCQNEAQWMYSLRLALRINLMEQCLKVADDNQYNKPQNFEKILREFENSVINTKPLLEEFVNKLTAQ